jgi:ABC-2 type transport system ATP-binding protein
MIVELKNASRWYGEVIGLNDVSATIETGITALLGQNGAGKSTFMRLVTGQLRPTAGTVEVFGQRPFGSIDVYRRLGYCPEIDNFYEHWSGRKFVNHMARLCGMSPSQAKTRTREVLTEVGMIDRCDRPIGGYSKGMRQRIKLAQAMVHNPDIILLDEPLNGLDPVGRREFMGMLESLANQGKAIVVSSHILYEVEQLTRNILLLHRGRLLATGDIRTIRRFIDKHPHRIRIETDNPRALGALILTMSEVVSMDFPPGTNYIDLKIKSPEGFYSRLPKVIRENGIPIYSFSSPDNNLESLFQYLVTE